MNRILYENRCRCNEDLAVTKKRKSANRSEGKPLQYPKSNEIISKSFQIKYHKKLSLISKLILNSFHNKYIYYAIDDIVCLLSAKRDEQNNLLSILYSSMLSLHNDFSVNFFDIWIDSVYWNEKYKTNRFLTSTSSNITKVNYTTITLKLHYFTRTPNKKPETIW